MEKEFSHTPVLLSEVIEGLNIRPDGVYVDCTLGGGGHSLEILKRLSTGILIGIDQDAAALSAAEKRLAEYRGHRLRLVKDNFSNIREILSSLGVDRIDGALLDLGVSSYQLDTPERGFSYNACAPLDMRMNTDAPLSAYDVVNTYSQAELARILYEYGEESAAGRIAGAIVKARETRPIQTTDELVEIIKSVMPKKRLAVGHHPAKKTFQAIRIEVNGELSILEPAISELTEHLTQGGRLAVITFHSLEDRQIKRTFDKLAAGCICPPSYPVCICGRKPKIKILTKKPILPSLEEEAANHRSHSAKLRVAEKL